MAVSTVSRITGIPTPLRRLYTTTTSYTTTGTSEEVAATYTLNGGTMARDGQVIRATVFGEVAANANAKNFRVYFGATVLQFASTQNNQKFRAVCEVVRVSGTSQFMTGSGFIASSLFALAQASPAETLSGDVSVQVRLLTASGAGDATFEGLILEFLE